MQLERESGRSGDAGLTGWISTNDVTLVLVVLVAVLVKGNLDATASELAATSEALAARDAQLSEKARALAEQAEELRRTAAQLSRTEEDLSSTSRVLLSAEERADLLDAELRARSEALESATVRLELTAQERDRVIAELRATRDALAELRSTLGGLRDENASLETSRASLNSELVRLGAELKSRVDALAEAEAERDRLRLRAAALDRIVTALEDKVAAANLDLEATRTRSADDLARAGARIAELERSAEDYMASLAAAVERLDVLSATRTTLEGRLSESESRFQAEQALRTRVKRELVGLAGGFKRVAVLFDASGSMMESDTPRGAARWAESQEIAKTWLRHLDVDECVLIVFASDVRVFPEDRSWADVRGAAGGAVRERLLQQIAAVTPSGATNTLEALRLAYSMEGVDTILLFSDGAPTNPRTGRFDQQIADRIYALCRLHPRVPVNTIGIGNYFDADFATFLRTLASRTGGTFQGR